MRVRVKGHLMPLFQHLLVELREITRWISKSCSNDKESNFHIFLIQDTHDPLRELRLPIINPKCK